MTDRPKVPAELIYPLPYFAEEFDSPDVVLDGVNVHVECKRVERLDLYGAMRQATDDAGDAVPIVWHRKNNEASVCIVQTCDLIRLAHEIVASQEAKQVK